MAAAALAAMVSCGTAAAVEYVDIDPPGSAQAEATGIDAAGNVSGFSRDKNGNPSAFLRLRSGQFIALGTHEIRTFTAVIGGKHQVAGVATGGHAYIADSHDNLTLFDAPGATETDPAAFNAKAAMAGFFYQTGTIVLRGFLRGRTGTIDTFDGPQAGTAQNTGTQVTAMNDAGVIAGFSIAGDSYSHGFVRQADGTIAGIAPADEGGSGIHGGTRPFAINKKGEIAGIYFTADREKPFLRDAKGGFVSFGPFTDDISVAALNNRSQIAGTYLDGAAYRGYIRSKRGEFTVFDHPKAGNKPGRATRVAAMNDKGVLVGFYVPKNGVRHAFMRLP